MKPARPAGTPAPYGRACVNCAHAKCKCMLLTYGIGCERCQRLGKECRPAQTVRKRNQRSSDAKAARLETGVDTVLANHSVLQSGTQSPSGIAHKSMNLSSVINDDEEMPYPSHIIPIYNEVLSLLSVSSTMAQIYLDQFRTHNLPYLPFVYIPADMTSDQLKERLPFFWTCIMEVRSDHDPTKGDSFGRITNHIHHRVLVDAAPSMDLLLGVMTFITWVTFSKKPFLNAYSHMLMGLVADLGINQPPVGITSNNEDYKSSLGIDPGNPAVRTLVERRVVLGCFVISSCVALSISRIDAMRWTPHMEQSLSVLAEAKECPADEILIAIVKMHLVLDRSYQLRRDGLPINSPNFYLHSFRTQLDAVKQEIPSHFRQHRVIGLYLAYAEITVTEMAHRPSASPHLPDLQRLDSLWVSLLASKSWLDLWLELKAEDYQDVSLVVFFQWTKAILNLYKLTVLDDPAWSKPAVRATADIIQYLDRIIAVFKSSPSSQVEEGKEPGIISKGLGIAEALKHNWEPRLLSMWGMNVPSTNNGNDIIQSDDILPPGMLMPQFDDSWMMELLGSM